MALCGIMMSRPDSTICQVLSIVETAGFSPYRLQVLHLDSHCTALQNVHNKVSD